MSKPSKYDVILLTSNLQDQLLAHTYTDAQLVDGARQLSRAHVEAIYRRYEKDLRAAIRKEDSNVTTDDIVSKVIMRLPVALEDYEEAGKLAAFLVTMAKFVIRDSRRTRARHIGHADASELPIAGSGAAMREIENDDAVGQLIRDMNEPRRTIWHMHKDGWGNVDIAAELNMTATAVGVALMRAKNFLQAEAEKRGITRADFDRTGVTASGIPGPNRSKKSSTPE